MEIVDEFRKCPRIIPPYSHEDSDSKKFWRSVFEAVENEKGVPEYTRLKVLKEVLPPHILTKVLRVITPDTSEYQGKYLPDLPKFDEPVPENFHKISLYDLLHKEGQEEESIPHVDFRKLLTGPSERSIYHKEYPNMYQKFLEQPESLSAKWRPAPELTFEGMDLNDKCEAIVIQIASDFIGWMKDLGGDEKTSLTVKGILNLFEIGFNAHAADSLCVMIRELNAVTKQVALSRNQPESSYTAQLYKQLFRDIKAIKRAEDMYAFGTMLPPEMRAAPQKDNIASKWVHNKRVPERIANMAVVWEGIERLRSTYGYCKWLLQHPHIPPPKYLLEKGMMSERVLNARVSFESLPSDME